MVNGYLIFSGNLDLKKHTKKTIKLLLCAAIWGIIIATITMYNRYGYVDFGKSIFIVYYWYEEWNVNVLWYLGALVSIYFRFPVLKASYDYKFDYFIYFTIIVGFLQLELLL